MTVRKQRQFRRAQAFIRTHYFSLSSTLWDLQNLQAKTQDTYSVHLAPVTWWGPNHYGSRKQHLGRSRCLHFITQGRILQRFIISERTERRERFALANYRRITGYRNEAMIHTEELSQSPCQNPNLIFFLSVFVLWTKQHSTEVHGDDDDGMRCCHDNVHMWLLKQFKWQFSWQWDGKQITLVLCSTHLEPDTSESHSGCESMSVFICINFTAAVLCCKFLQNNNLDLYSSS